MIRPVLTAIVLALPGLALAKLPAPPQDAASLAKAAETKAKAAWQAKVAAYKLCLVQDRIAARYGDKAGNTGSAMPVSTAAPTTPSNSGNPVTAAQGGGTPTAASAPTLANCVDPGPFAYTPPAQKPLEAAGAHSPAGTAATPPNVQANSAQMNPSKPGVAPDKKP